VIVFGDANFGILPRDVEIAQHVRKLYEETKSFSRVHMYWAKIAKPHMVDIGKALGHLTQTYVAFQSLDPEVLANIKRRNIRTDELVKLIDQLQEFTDAAQTDILVGLPGETYDSHLRSLDSALDLGINLIHGGEIRMLPGSEMDSEETRTTFAIKTKYRFFEGGYGMYRGQFVYELEEGIRATSTMSEEEMLKLRALRAFFYAGVTLGEHLPLVSYLRTRGIRFTRVCEQMVNEGLADPRFGPSVRWLIETSRNEWHATEEAAADYVAQGENRRGLLEDSMFVKLNTGFLAKIYLEPEQYMAYYDVLARVITKLDPTVDQQVLGELLDICRNRNYLIKCLRGDFASTRLTFEISRATQEVLVEAQFLTEQDAQLNPGKISLSVNPTTAEFCATYVNDHPRMNNMELSQVLLLQAGRFLMKPRKRAESRLTADHLITMPAEVS
ncbi:MAG: hypothetical protein HY216_16865, partial [Candidatus Rokubacteria bacterium]|nr:hypothetical protein [Candidatus Rokubacteria bacterium]